MLLELQCLLLEEIVMFTLFFEHASLQTGSNLTVFLSFLLSVLKPFLDSTDNETLSLNCDVCLLILALITPLSIIDFATRSSRSF